MKHCPNCTGCGNQCPNKKEVFTFRKGFCIKCEATVYVLESIAVPLCDDCNELFDDFEDDFEEDVE